MSLVPFAASRIEFDPSECLGGKEGQRTGCGPPSFFCPVISLLKPCLYYLKYKNFDKNFKSAQILQKTQKIYDKNY
jgi:hypothetical protein